MRVLSDEVKKKISEKVKICGWVHEMRDLGGIKFILLRDRRGIIQVTASKKEVSQKVFEKVLSIGREYVLCVEGKVRKSAKAPKGVEIVPENIQVLAKAHSPLPLDPSQKVKSEFDTRLNHRVMDLRNPKVRAIFKVEECFISGFREYLTENDFTEIHTPKIVATATEGGTELFPVSYFEKEAFLAQSPQFYKQMCVGAGFERVFEVGPVYRAEEHNTVRHLNEYVSLDVEFGFIEDDSDLRKLENKLLVYMFEKLERERRKEVEVFSKIPQVPEKIPEIKFQEALEILGTTGYDLSPEDEKKLYSYSLEEYDSEFLFITTYPREKRPMYAMPLDEKFTRSFDLLFRGWEITTGGQRIHQYDLLCSKIKERGLRIEDFSFYLEVFKYGMPPHGGFAIGAERLTVKTLNLKNLREASLFPRDRFRLVP